MRVVCIGFITFLLFQTNLMAADATLAQASIQARSTMEVFWQKFEANQHDPHTFEIKAKVKLADGSETIAWIGELKTPNDGLIVGTIMRKPNELTYHSQYNRMVKFRLDDIQDWGYREEKETASKIYGHFTTRLLLDKMSKRDRQLWQNTLSTQPLPSAEDSQ